ncbi:Thioredoxin domain-containing protein [Heracleum sosnowskyi]|uniref:Thioredoxin domain-containing protein n=1 Tax=Heracleum sosnowskyi TaxID=360622 RepID=A0AAD8MK97_9APIA|nr:Thioredoxin domain-containing protein [Heracleum sosnowskyi]
MRGISVVRRLINTRKLTQLSSLSSSSIYTKTLASSSSSPSPPPSSLTHPNASFHFPQFSYRNYCSSSPSGPSNIVLVESEEQFTSSLRQVKDNSQPAIYYFTAVWCPPCKLLSPIIGQLSEKYPHVTTYKIDIDQEELGNVLSELDINSVPTLHFFRNGEKASEVVGADLERIRETMENLYK